MSLLVRRPLSVVVSKLRAARMDTGAGALPGSGTPSGGFVSRSETVDDGTAPIAAGIGSVRTCVRTLVLLGSAVAALLAVSPGVAQAVTFGGTGSDAGQLSFPMGVAVNQASGDVYIADQANNRVDEFDRQGTFVMAFGWGVADGTTAALQTCTTTCFRGLSGAGSGQFNQPAGVAVDPVSGDVYVVDLTNHRVQKFDPSGHFIVMFGGNVDKTTNANLCTVASGDACGVGTTGTANGQFSSWAFAPSLIAVDGAGRVYVGDANRVQEFDSGGNYVGQLTLSGSGNTTAVAVNAVGDVYEVSSAVAGVREYDPTGTLLNTLDASGTPRALTVNGSGNLFIRDFSGATNHVVIQHFLEYDSAGNARSYFDSGPITGVFGGLAFDDTAGVLWAADNNDDDVVGVSLPPPGPFLESGTELATNVGSTVATLNATISPEGNSTGFHFEYGTTSAYGTSIPLSDATAGSAVADVAVSQSLSGLTPNAVYHFRVVATNSQGTVTGPDATFTTNSSAAPLAANSSDCSNAAFRVGPSASLPDCRAYEQVTPVNKNGTQDMFVTGGTLDPALVTDGGKVLLDTTAALGPNPNAANSQYVFDRTAAGWTMTSITPPGTGAADQLIGVSNADLSEVGVLTGVVDDTASLPPQELQIGPPGGPYTTIGTSPVGSEIDGYTGATSDLMGASSDFSHVVFESLDHTLAPGASAQADHTHAIYEWSEGRLQLVNVNTDGSLISACGAIVGSGPAEGLAHNAVSSDGSKIFFVSPDPTAKTATDPSCWKTSNPTVNPPQLYMRENAQTTVDISCSPSVPHPNGCQLTGFVGAASDGSKVFFLSAPTVTNLSFLPVNGELYEYDVASGTVRRISGGTSGTAPGNVQWAFPSDDGSTVWFGANGQLTPNAPVPAGGMLNLYRYDTTSDTTTYIATINQTDYQQRAALNTAFFGYSYNNGASWYTTPDGRFLVFSTTAHLTGYSNGPYRELYRYDSRDGSLLCVSCSPDGSAATGDASFEFGISIAGPPSLMPAAPTTRPISSDGSYVFFDSPDRLVPQDTNNARDVYEWHDGRLSLISAGTGSVDSIFLGASADGSDVFFGTHDPLAPSDTDLSGDLYDARIGGGFPPPAATTACSGDGCQGPLSAAPALPTAATVSFGGPGNVTPAAGSPAASAKATVLTRVVRGSAFVVAVNAPRKGRITISGAGIRTVTRAVAHAGTFRLRVALTSRMKRALQQRRKLKLPLRVGYTPAGGQGAAVRFQLTVKA